MIYQGSVQIISIDREWHTNTWHCARGVLISVSHCIFKIRAWNFLNFRMCTSTRHWMQKPWWWLWKWWQWSPLVQMASKNMWVVDGDYSMHFKKTKNCSTLQVLLPLLSSMWIILVFSIQPYFLLWWYMSIIKMLCCISNTSCKVAQNISGLVAVQYLYHYLQLCEEYVIDVDLFVIQCTFEMNIYIYVWWLAALQSHLNSLLLSS